MTREQWYEHWRVQRLTIKYWRAGFKTSGHYGRYIHEVNKCWFMRLRDDIPQSHKLRRKFAERSLRRLNNTILEPMIDSTAKILGIDLTHLEGRN